VAPDSDREDGGQGHNDRSGIYRPPKLAPVPYTETSSAKDKEKKPRTRLPSALASLSHLSGSNPHVESSSGLGATPSLASGRARELQRMTEFEEGNMTRLVMNKKESKRRRMDEEDIALGGAGGGGGGGRRRGGGLEDEFGDVLKAVGKRKSKNLLVGDGYEELRQMAKKSSALERSRARNHDDDDAPTTSVEGDGRMRKRGRFQTEVKTNKQRVKKRT